MYSSKYLKPTTRHRTGLAALTSLAALLLAGCGSSTSHDSAAATPSAPASVSATPSPTPTAKPPAPLTATDGTDLHACLHNRCEVLISAGDVIRLDGRYFTKLSIKKITKGKVTFDLTSPYGHSSGVAVPDCVATYGANGGGVSCGRGATPTGTGLTMRIPKVSSDRAVLSLSVR